MGCGASLDVRTKEYVEPAWRAGLVTPPESSRGADVLPSSSPKLRGVTGLSINAGPNRNEEGMAATPIGKQAEEFKHYCPLCMMFFRWVLEFPCCRQTVCCYCFVEYVQRQSHFSFVSHSDHQLPSGVPCPQCAVAGRDCVRPLRVVDGVEEARSYATSPVTKAQMLRIGEAREGACMAKRGMPPPSPLKIGDDVQAMARKMLPFDYAAGGTETPDASLRGERSTECSGLPV